MSNKTQLQINNASLDGYISRIQAAKEVAATLPEAGGGAEPVIEPLEITENGTYTAPDGINGYSPVTVNVPTGGGNVGGLTQYAKITATPSSTMSFSIANPLGGIAKKVSIQRTVETATSSRKCQKCLIDLETGIGICEFLDTSGRVRYPIVLTNGTPSNGDFKISDGAIVVYRYNSANAWDASNEYEVEIWQ